MIIVTNTASTIKVASEVDLLKSISSKMLEVSLSIIAPTIAKEHFKMYAKTLAKNRGSLK